MDGVFEAMQAYHAGGVAQESFYDDSVRRLNVVLDARRDRLVASADSDLPLVIAALILVGSIVILGYVTLVGSPERGVSRDRRRLGRRRHRVLARRPAAAPVPVLRRARGRLAPVQGRGAGAAPRRAEMTHDEALAVLAAA